MNHRLRFGEENDYLRMFCGFALSSDFNNSSTRGGIMETIEICFAIAGVVGAFYLVADAFFDRIGM